jgi:hypothetical protein
MDYLFQDGGKPKKTKSKTKTGTKTATKTKTGTKTATKTKTGTKTATKSKTTKSKSSSKKGGNFLGTVGDLVAPTGWGPFATAAALVGLDRVDAALRRGKSTKSSAKKGGMRGGTIIRDKLHEIYMKKLKEAMNAPLQTTNKNREEIREIYSVYRDGTVEKVLELLKVYVPNYSPSAADKGEIEPIFTGPSRERVIENHLKRTKGVSTVESFR